MSTKLATTDDVVASLLRRNALQERLRAARKEVGKQTFGTDGFESAMVVVRDLCAQVDSESGIHDEPFCSVDSGIHPTRLRDGRIISR